jgi:hypothetical protein
MARNVTSKTGKNTATATVTIRVLIPIPSKANITGALATLGMHLIKLVIGKNTPRIMAFEPRMAPANIPRTEPTRYPPSKVIKLEDREFLTHSGVITYCTDSQIFDGGGKKGLSNLFWISCQIEIINTGNHNL